jgi:hypothetical protein
MCYCYFGVACFCREITTEIFDSMRFGISAAMVNQRIETNKISGTHWNGNSVGWKHKVK